MHKFNFFKFVRVAVSLGLLYMILKSIMESMFYDFEYLPDILRVNLIPGVLFGFLMTVIYALMSIYATKTLHFADKDHFKKQLDEYLGKEHYFSEAIEPNKYYFKSNIFQKFLLGESDLMIELSIGDGICEITGPFALVNKIAKKIAY